MWPEVPSILQHHPLGPTGWPRVPPRRWPSRPEHFWGCSDLPHRSSSPWQLCLPLCLCGQKYLGFPGIPIPPFPSPVPSALGLEPSKILPFYFCGFYVNFLGSKQ